MIKAGFILRIAAGLLLCASLWGCKGGGFKKGLMAFDACKARLVKETSVDEKPGMSKKEIKKLKNQVKENIKITCGEIKTACKNRKSPRCQELLKLYIGGDDEE